MKAGNLMLQRVDRPDVVEYRTQQGGRDLSLFWDDRPGIDAGWVLRLSENNQERDIPMKGRLNSKHETLWRNILEALR